MKHTLLFGLQLNEQFLPQYKKDTTAGIETLGSLGLLNYLETRLGLAHSNANIGHLRTEHFRQGMAFLEEQKGNSPFTASFEADSFATAAALLQLRDELKLSAWNFEITDNTPARLVYLAQLEQVIHEQLPQPFLLGFADRLALVEEHLDLLIPDFDTIFLNEPLSLLPPHFKRLFASLAEKGINIKVLPEHKIVGNSDLSKFKNAILADEAEKFSPKGDGSLLIIKSKRETDLAAWVACLLCKNPDFKPSALIPERNRTLDQALSNIGLPSLGMLSASSARPSLQILKLVPAFIWTPLDPFKVMEFVTLAVKPLRDDLAITIARQMASMPGLHSDSWYAMQEIYFEKLAEKAAEDPSINVAQVRKEYNFWFNRKRYNIAKSAPKSDIIEMYQYISQWAREAFEESQEENTSLLVLAEQARRIVDLLYSLPPSMDFLRALELERVVRTIYEPSPVTFKPKEAGHLPYTADPASIMGKVDKLIWWNFTQNERDHFFSRWYPEELNYLSSLSIKLQGPKEENDLLLWQRTRPILQTQEQLILCIPENVNGSGVYTHPLFDELLAYTNSLAAIEYETCCGTEIPPIFEKSFKLPQFAHLEHHPLSTTQMFLELDYPALSIPNESESITSLSSLFYYPYQWVFRNKARLQSSSILSIVEEVTLKGNLSHRFFELLFKEDIYSMDKAAIHEWIDAKAPGLLAKEGAVLLLYGKEPDKIGFLNAIKKAAWSLISMIQSNRWQVEGTEVGLGGNFETIPLRGKADLVLKNDKGEKVVIDLKWRGTNWRKEMIKNNQDLQLVTYAQMLSDGKDWAHTSYFVIDAAKMIARNNEAFKEAEAVTPDMDFRTVNQQIWKQMIATYQWRIKQLENGKVEIRTKQTVDDLVDHYGSELLDVLEQNEDDAAFDEYSVLIGRF